MNALLPKLWRSAYRKEPISSFILIVGSVDAVIGGIGQRWSLLSIGITLALIAVVLRVLQTQKNQTATVKSTARYVLPPSTSRPPLPLLVNDKTNR
jgi:hypothetical protein